MPISFIRSKIAAHPILTTLFCLLLGATLVYTIFVLRARSRALAGMGRLASLGMPRSTAEYLKQFDTDPTDPTVARLEWLTALSRVVQPPSELASRLSNWLDGGSELNFLRDQTMQDIEGYVFANEAAYVQIKETLAEFSPSEDYSRLKLDGLALAWAADLLFMRTLVDLDIGDNHAAMSDLTGMLQVADMLADSREGVPCLFRHVVLLRAVNGTLASAIAGGALPDTDLVSLAQSLAAQDRGGRIQECLGEMFSRNCDLPDGAIVGSLSAELEPRFVRYTGIAPAQYSSLAHQQQGTLSTIGAHWPSFSTYVSYMEHCVAAARHDVNDRWSEYCSVLSRLDTGVLPSSTHVDYDRDRHVTHRLFLHDARSVTVLRLGRIAIALEQYRREHDEYPVALDQLVPKQLADLPISPFDASAFSYEVTPDGVRVFCLGGAETASLNSKGNEISIRVYSPRPTPQLEGA